MLDAAAPPWDGIYRTSHVASGDIDVNLDLGNERRCVRLKTVSKVTLTGSDGNLELVYQFQVYRCVNSNL